MPVFKGKDGSGKEITFIQEEGYNYPYKIVEVLMQNDFKKKLYGVRDFDVRDDDILICAFFKSGMHWLWEIVSMVVNKTSEYDKNSKEALMMDFKTTEELDSVAGRRILNLHFPLPFVPRKAFEKKIPIIHIMRNPKDVCVSYYNHYNTLPLYTPVENFSAFLSMFIGENGFYLKFPWYQYVLDWEKITRANPDYPILNLYYEDLKEDLKSVVKKISDFLKVDINDDLIDRIVDKCHIENMRHAVKEHDFVKGFLVDGRPLMYRKGQVGDWKNWFTVAENEKFDRWLEENLKDTNLKFRYTL